jgi:biopolymer transport protein ExbB
MRSRSMASMTPLASIALLCALVLPAGAIAEEKAPPKASSPAGKAAPAKPAEEKPKSAEEKPKASATQPAAPPRPQADEAPKPRETLFSLIQKGRWIMYPLAVCSVFVFALAIERALSLRKKKVGTLEILDQVVHELPQRARATREQVARAGAVCAASDSILGKVLRSGVEKIHRDEAHAVEALEEAGAREMSLLRRKVRPLSVISALGPLLGLLGTISGMITCFEQATAADSSSRVSTLTQGIYEALVATATGLLVAIIALILYHFFLGKVDRVGDRIDEVATRFVDHYYGVPLTVKARAPQSHAAGETVESGHAGDEEGAPLLEAGG